MILLSSERRAAAERTDSEQCEKWSMSRSRTMKYPGFDYDKFEHYYRKCMEEERGWRVKH